jgi:hypothetical protein
MVEISRRNSRGFFIPSRRTKSLDQMDCDGIFYCLFQILGEDFLKVVEYSRSIG